MGKYLELLAQYLSILLQHGWDLNFGPDIGVVEFPADGCGTEANSRWPSLYAYPLLARKKKIW